MIWHSGKLRARQTAEAFWRRCNPLSALSAVRGLQPADPVSWIVGAIAAEARDLMLVGHFPQMPLLLTALLGVDGEPATREFPTNGIVALEDVGGKWVECWRDRP